MPGYHGPRQSAKTMKPDHAAMLADALLVLHFAVILFNIGGLILIVIGGVRGWGWVRCPAFRVLHLALIAFIVLQTHLGELCPLTGWEQGLRRSSGRSAYSESFIEHWMSRLIYYDAPWWIFVVAYTAFGIIVVASWVWVRPRPWRQSGR